MLELRQVTVAYGASPVLHSVSFEVPSGACSALIGANGAGKTTTLRAISGLVRPRQGQILFEGQDITNWAPERITAAGISHVPEGRRIFAGLTVLENLEVATTPRKDRSGVKSDLVQVYTLFPRLHERRTQLGWSLSGGEQQMLAIGRAIMARPRLLMLDEASLGLAPLVVVEVYKAIQEINRQGITVLLVEQNVSLAMRLAQWSYALQRGVLTLSGTTNDLKNDPRLREVYLGA
ncbi:MAG: hypothetical protein JWN15_2914 [Firmicutes bacterium]|nr:hypothetical protein [Bacillota bacterium]